MLLSINFPDLDGFREQIIHLSKNHHTPIILLCNPKDFESDRVYYWNADDYITQPFNPAELLVKIKTHIQTAQLKRQLIANEACQATILNHSRIAIAYTDIHLNVIKTNAQFYLQYGYKENIKTLKQILKNPPDTHTFEHCFAKILQQGEIDCELETQHKNGNLSWSHIKGKLINNNTPKQGLVWILDDITSRKANQDQQQLLATVFKVSGEAMAILDENGNIEQINPAMQQLIGFSANEMYQKPVTCLLDSTNQHQQLKNILCLVQRQQQWKGELWLKKKSGNTFPTQITFNCITRQNGTVSHFVAIMADITERKAQEKELKRRANHDPLTELPNRNEFFVRLNEALAIAKRHKYNVILLYLDLDGFKAINDTLGHGKGDDVLKDVANKLQHCLREVDTVARLGGDEFAIILNGSSKEKTIETAKRLIRASTMDIDNSLPLSVSIGISVFPNDALNPHKLLQYADEAMYKAKQQGKQSYCWHNSTLP